MLNQALFRDENDPGLSFGFVAVPARRRELRLLLRAAVHWRWGYVPRSRIEEASVKRMIVQATNIGADVFSGQMDLMIPGGGTGLFNGCTRQWGNHDSAPPTAASYQCQNEHCAVCANNGGRLRCVGVEFPDAQHEEVKKCVARDVRRRV